MWLETASSWRNTYLGMGEKMLRPARNFLMVPLVLNQLCLFSCWVFKKSLLRCFHCWDVNIPRILKNHRGRDLESSSRGIPGQEIRLWKTTNLKFRLRDCKASWFRELCLSQDPSDIILAHEREFKPMRHALPQFQCPLNPESVFFLDMFPKWNCSPSQIKDFQL